MSDHDGDERITLPIDPGADADDKIKSSMHLVSEWDTPAYVEGASMGRFQRGCLVAVLAPFWIVAFCVLLNVLAPAIRMTPIVDGRPDVPVRCGLGDWVFAEPEGQGVEVDYIQRECANEWWDTRHVREVMFLLLVVTVSGTAVAWFAVTRMTRSPASP